MDTATTILRPRDTAIGVIGAPYSADLIKELVAAMEVPFDPSQIEWRVMKTTKNQQPRRGQVVPYADQRAYTDRLNVLFFPAARRGGSGRIGSAGAEEQDITPKATLADAFSVAIQRSGFSFLQPSSSK